MMLIVTGATGNVIRGHSSREMDVGFHLWQNYVSHGETVHKLTLIPSKVLKYYFQIMLCWSHAIPTLYLFMP